LICGLCRARWTRLPPPWCPRCGQPQDQDLECRVCLDWPRALSQVRSAVWLTGTARNAVHHLKYGGWWRAADAMAGAMHALDCVDDEAVIVPVPLGAARLRARGYNQSASLAQALAKHSGATVAGGLLRRVRETPTQTGLSPEARRANTHAAFTARSMKNPVCRDRRLVLVDDVFTTGATIVGAAEALIEAGANRVAALTFARARRPLDDDVCRLHRTFDS